MAEEPAWWRFLDGLFTVGLTVLECKNVNTKSETRHVNSTVGAQ